MQLDQAVADEERRREAGLDRLLVRAADDEPIDDGVDVLDVIGVARRTPLVPALAFDSIGDVDQLSVDDHPSAALPPHFGEHDVEILAVNLEHRRAQLDLGALRQRQNRLEDLAGRA